MKNLNLLFLFSILAITLGSTMPLQDAYAATVTINSATVSSPTAVTIVFSGIIDVTASDYTDLNVARL